MSQKLLKEDFLFSIKRKPLVSSYGSYQKTLNYLNRSGRIGGQVLHDLSTFTNGDQLDKYFKSPGSRNHEAIVISDTLYSTNRIYAGLLDYLKDMYYWRYVTVPRKIKNFDKKAKKKEYQEMYQKMLEVIEGLSVETTFPTILLNIFKNGQVFLYCDGQKTSKTVTTIMLPNHYCRATTITQFGTQEIDFDLSFFDNLGLSDSDKERLLNLFPSEFRELYETYRKDPALSRWQHLSGKRSTCISMNESGFPTFLSVFYDIIDYKTYKINELDRNANLLERIVAQEIDMEKTQLDMEEVESLHNSMADVICDNRGTKLLTTVGKLDVHQLQESEGIENKTLTNAFATIYDNAGFNNALFIGEGPDSVRASQTRDLNYVWNFIEKITIFFNLAVNNIYNFHDYQVSLRLLPISPYNEAEKLEQFKANATLGVDKIGFIVSSGIKQVDLESTMELEEFLGLAERLKPLQSSHTQSSMEEEREDTPKEGEIDEEATPTPKEIPPKKE